MSGKVLFLVAIVAMACAASAAQDMTTTQLLENEGARGSLSSIAAHMKQAKLNVETFVF